MKTTTLGTVQCTEAKVFLACLLPLAPHTICTSAFLREALVLAACHSMPPCNTHATRIDPGPWHIAEPLSALRL